MIKMIIVTIMMTISRLSSLTLFWSRSSWPLVSATR